MTSSWQLGPVVRGIRGHRAAAALVVAQLAIGLAITVLAVLMGDYFVRRNALPSSLPEDDLLLVELRAAGGAGEAAAARHAAALAAARATPAVAAAAPVRLLLDALEHPPDHLRAAAGGPAIAAYELEAGAGVLAAAGVALAAGRDLADDDLRAPAAVPAIVSASLAAALWPGRDPIGATFTSRSHGAAVVVGVAGALRSRLLGRDDRVVVFAADLARAPHALLLVRSAPGQAAAVHAELPARLASPGAHAAITPVAAITRRMAAPVDAVLGVLAAMVGAIVVVILTGSMGLTYFLVARRTREIGLRRAMGATRGDVVRHFVVENALYTAAGAGLGLAIVAAVLPAMARAQEDFVVRWPLVAAAGLAVVLLNLIATLIPASRAAAVPPAVASRTT